jgi:hypothetical protein
MAGALFSGFPTTIYASTDEDRSNEGGSEEGGGEEESEPEPEPEPEPTPAEPTPAIPITEPPVVEPVVPEPEQPPTTTVDCPEGYVLNDVDQCIHPPVELETEPQPPIDPCLLDPGHESCPLPDPITGQCPEGYNMNVAGQCFPEHMRCPEGYHSHEDDESGRCIPDSTPCDDGYIMNPSFPSCELKEFVCAEFPDAKGCEDKPPDACIAIYPPPPECRDPNDDDDDDDDERHKVIIKKINIHKTVHNTKDFPEVDIIGLGLKNTGDAMVCIMNIDNDWVQCQEFGVPNDRINENIWRIIEADSDKDYDNGNTGSTHIDLTIKDIKEYDFGELDDDRTNHDFGIALAALGINPQGDGLICLIEDDRNEGTALCEPFKVSNEAISGQITEITEID